MLENPISSTTVGVQWEPTWLVDCGNDCKVGITMDDGCYLVLVQDQKAQWQPTKWIPAAAARFMGKSLAA